MISTAQIYNTYDVFFFLIRPSVHVVSSSWSGSINTSPCQSLSVIGRASGGEDGQGAGVNIFINLLISFLSFWVERTKSLKFESSVNVSS